MQYVPEMSAFVQTIAGLRHYGAFIENGWYSRPDMARRVRNDSKDSRDWLTRAIEDRALAEKMPPGPVRDEAIKKAEQLRSAAEMMGYLQSSDLRAPK